MAHALIFDCDGVLVDSEPLSVTELGRSLREAGSRITDADLYRRMVGRSVASILSIIKHEEGVDAAPFMPAYRSRLAERIAADLRPIPGISAAIRAMDPLPRIIASSSTPGRIAQSLEVTGLAALFGTRICSAVEVTNGKPAPDLFLLAARRLDVQPRDCIVIEDSEHGVRAAHAAGMKVIGFLGGSHAEQSDLPRRLPALGVDALAHDATELPGLVARLTSDNRSPR